MYKSYYEYFFFILASKIKSEAKGKAAESSKKKLAPMFLQCADVDVVLKEVFGHDRFRSDTQEKAVRAVMKGQYGTDSTQLCSEYEPNEI